MNLRCAIGWHRWWFHQDFWFLHGVDYVEVGVTFCARCGKVRK
jgi:hypothetical protein